MKRFYLCTPLLWLMVLEDVLRERGDDWLSSFPLSSNPLVELINVGRSFHLTPSWLMIYTSPRQATHLSREPSPSCLFYFFLPLVRLAFQQISEPLYGGHTKMICGFASLLQRQRRKERRGSWLFDSSIDSSLKREEGERKEVGYDVYGFITSLNLQIMPCIN